MPLLADRVKEVSATTGTGTINLGGAATGFQSFASAFASGSSVYYTIAAGSEWEVGHGTYTTAVPDTLSRDVVLASSNADALVNFSTGAKDVFCTIPAAFLDTKADIDSPVFTGTVGGITSAMVGLGNVNNTSDVNKPVSTAQAAADTAAENAAKAYADGLAVNYDAAGSASTAQNNAEAYADGLVVGLLDDRGNYDASGNVFPSTGGSGTAGAILQGDLWYVNVAGTLGGVAVTAGDVVRALADAPGQTASNWAVTEVNLGYTPENAANKSTTLDADKASDTKYPSVKSVYDWATGLFALLSGKLSQFAATTSAELAGVISDETGSGSLVFANSPTLVTPALGTPASGTMTNCTGLPAGGLSATATDVLFGRSTAGAGAGEEIACTAFARSILDDANEATFKATVNLEIGTDVQAYDAELAAIAGLTSAADKLPYFTGSGTAALADLTAAARTVLDDATVSAMVDTIGGAASTGTGGLVRKTGAAIDPATISVGAGSVSAPSLYLSTDNTTGFYRIGANNNGYAISGVKTLDISATVIMFGSSATPPTVAAGNRAMVLSADANKYCSLLLQNATTGSGGTDGFLVQLGIDNVSAYVWNYENGPLRFATNNTDRGGFAASGGFDVTGKITATTTIKTGGYTVATLPAGTTGDRAYVTDALAPTWLAALTGGGAVECPAFKTTAGWVSA